MSHLSGVRANRAAKRLGERINVETVQLETDLQVCQLLLGPANVRK
jgi:hypothetical protein